MQVKDRAARARRDGGEVHTAEVLGHGERAVVVEVDLEERIAAGIARRAEFMHEPLEGKILIIEGFERHRADLREVV